MALRDNMEAWWSMDEASGTRADSHNSNDLTENGTGGVGQGTGKISNAADLVDTDSDYLSLTSTSAFQYSGTQDRSCSLWFKPDSTTGVNTLFSKWGNGGSGEQEYILYTNGTNLVLGIRGTGAAITATGAISVGTWYHVVFTLNSSNTGELFINNSSQGTASGGAQSAGTSEIRIGQNGATNYYDGLIDEVSWYSTILSSTERSDLYNSGNAIGYSDTAGTARTLPPSGGAVNFSSFAMI